VPRSLAFLALVLATGLGQAEAPAPVAPKPAPNGIARPEGYQAWRVLGVSQRTENGTLRAILGNATAVAAAAAGNTNPWPDGTILAKISWKQATHPQFPTAQVPGELVQTDFMVKDAAKYAPTGGWGYARWMGDQAEVYGKDAGFAQECMACHTAAKATDFVFTRPVRLP
jgi:hypothetical protein